MSDVDKLLNEQVQTVSEATGVQPSIAKILLKHYGWQTADILERMRKDAQHTLIEAYIEPKSTNNNVLTYPLNGATSLFNGTSCTSTFPLTGATCTSSYPLTGATSHCGVCFGTDERLRCLRCAHRYCVPCWDAHFTVKLDRGVSSALECMHATCALVCPEDFVQSILSRAAYREKYATLCARDYIESYPCLRYCPGADCTAIVYAPDCTAPLYAPEAHGGPIVSTKAHAGRVVCSRCAISFCFRCATDYHAPTDCDTIQKWLAKCRDDSETYNYICANTKDCPKCRVCIEKSGGCNHMVRISHSIHRNIVL
jgi:ariadne-2